MFVVSFKNGDDDPARNSFHEYYMPLEGIADFNALINNKPFLDQPVKNKQEAYEKLIEMSRNNEYTANILTGINWNKLIGIYLSRKTNTSTPYQINFPGILEEDDKAIMLFIAEK